MGVGCKKRLMKLGSRLRPPDEDTCLFIYARWLSSEAPFVRIHPAHADTVVRFFRYQDSHPPRIEAVPRRIHLPSDEERLSVFYVICERGEIFRYIRGRRHTPAPRRIHFGCQRSRLGWETPCPIVITERDSKGGVIILECICLWRTRGRSLPGPCQRPGGASEVFWQLSSIYSIWRHGTTRKTKFQATTQLETFKSDPPFFLCPSRHRLLLRKISHLTPADLFHGAAWNVTRNKFQARIQETSEISDPPFFLCPSRHRLLLRKISHLTPAARRGGMDMDGKHHFHGTPQKKPKMPSVGVFFFSARN